MSTQPSPCPPSTLAPGAGVIGSHDEDADMTLLRDGCDEHAAGRPTPDGFWDAYVRRVELLRRTACKLGMTSASAAVPMAPKTVRVCASYLLSN